MSRAGLFVPLGVFLLIALFGFVGFQLNDPHKLPSALLNQPFPEFDAEPLRPGGQPLTRADLLGEPVLVNVWATWCPTCRAEHEELNRLRREEGLKIIGINYKDEPRKARRWLAELGDPYSFNIQDPDGRIGVELGVYGAPESFLLDAEGIIRYKHVGDVNVRIWRDKIEPILSRLRAQSGS